MRRHETIVKPLAGCANIHSVQTDGPPQYEPGARSAAGLVCCADPHCSGLLAFMQVRVAIAYRSEIVTPADTLAGRPGS